MCPSMIGCQAKTFEIENIEIKACLGNQFFFI
jgi:hypothetical protein